MNMTHVYGHQDNNTDYDKLTSMEQANVDANDIAFAQNNTDSPHCDDCFIEYPAAKCCLYIGGKPITGKQGPSLRQAFAKQRLSQYLEQKFKWTSKQIDKIWWESIATATREQTTSVTTLNQIT